MENNPLLSKDISTTNYAFDTIGDENLNNYLDNSNSI